MACGAAGAQHLGMTYSPDVPSRSEKTSISMAAAAQGPWGLALVGGAVLGGGSLALHLLTGHLTLAGPLSYGLAVFLLIGSAGALLRKGHDRARAWAQAHPWSYATLPAVITAAGTFGIDLFLSTRGLFSSVWDGLWSGIGLLFLLGLIGYVARAVRPARR